MVPPVKLLIATRLVSPTSGLGELVESYERALVDAARGMDWVEFRDVYDPRAVGGASYTIIIIGMRGPDVAASGTQEDVRQWRHAADDPHKAAVGVALLAPATSAERELASLLVEPNGVNRTLTLVEGPDEFRLVASEWLQRFAVVSQGGFFREDARIPPRSAESIDRGSWNPYRMGGL